MSEYNSARKKQSLTDEQFKALLFVRKNHPHMATWLTKEGIIPRADEKLTHFQLSNGTKRIKIPVDVWTSVKDYLITARHHRVLLEVSIKGLRLMHEYIDS